MLNTFNRDRWDNTVLTLGGWGVGGVRVKCPLMAGWGVGGG